MDWERLGNGLYWIFIDLMNWLWARPYRNTVVGLMLVVLFSQTIGLIVSEFFFNFFSWDWFNFVILRIISQ